MPLQHEHILNPITAVDFCPEGSDSLVVLAAEGSFLKLYNAKSSKLLQQCEIFHSQAIHGIATHETSQDDKSLKVVVWGGPYMVTIRNLELGQILKGDINTLADAAISGPDWIMDVALSPENPNKFALITAHNTVLQARLDDISGTTMLDTPSSPSRSILYSAHILWESPSTLLVAAGTVFGEIIAWKCDITGVSEVLHSFTGHEGSIFGVNISQPILLPDKTTGRLLASCSDDRTIRVWKFASEMVEMDHHDQMLILRETGFDGSPVEDTLTGYGLLATVMGHASRIWGVKFVIRKLDEDTFDNVSVLSLGEDSTTQYWSLDFGSDFSKDFLQPQAAEKLTVTKGRLVHQNTFAFHSGKHIFTSALLSTPKQDFKVVTGGADGKISIYAIEPATKDASHDVENDRPAFWDLQEIIQSCSPDSSIVEELIAATELPVEQTPVIDPISGMPAKKPKVKKIPKDALNCYGFLTEDLFIMTTTFGRVFLGKIDSHVKWQEILLPDDSPRGLESYALITGFPELGLAFLAGADGKVYIYQNGNQLREVANIGHKIADMFKIHDHKSNSFQLLVTTLGSPVATLFDMKDSFSGSLTLQNISEYQLPEKFVVTSAGRMNDLLLFGSRAGNLALYSKSEAPLYIWIRPSGSAPESITTIIPVPSEKASSHVLTTDREGKYTILSCITTYSEDRTTIISALLTPVHHGNPSFGPMVENAWFSGLDHDLILYGFRSKSFVVWNHSHQFEISNVDCGGAHRSYAYSPLSSKGGGHFVYTKGSKLYIHTQSTLSHEIMKKGGHGREIKASAVSPDQRYIATGAEDTEIRLWSYDPNSTDKLGEGLSCKAIVQKHTAGIQSLKFHGKYLFSSGGYEEFNIFSISQVPNFGVGIVCEASNLEHTPDRDLRIMSFDVSNSADSNETLLISLAFSDSTFKSYAYSEAAGFTLVGKGRYTSSCLMQIKHLRVGGREVRFVTASTDGKLVLWKHVLPSVSSISTSQPSEIYQISSFKVHQSSIKALDLTKSRDEKKILIITGGDDNAIAITVYNNDDLAIPPKSFILRSAHAAAVTGISFIPSPSTVSASVPEGERFVFASSSNDQRVKQWEVKLSSSLMPNVEAGAEHFSLEIKQIGDSFTAVADVGDISVLCCEGRAKVIVVGNGMEVWDVSC